MIARIHALAMDMDGGLLATFKIPKEKRMQAFAELDNLRNADLILSVKKDKPIRSLNANSYFHVLVTKIAEKMDLGQDEVKKQLILEYGTAMTDEEDNTVAIKLPSSVKADIVYKYAKWYDRVEEDGKYFDCYMIYKQSHTLDSKEMARLIDGAVKEAEELGIETLEQIKLKALTDKWEVKEE